MMTQHEPGWNGRSGLTRCLAGTASAPFAAYHFGHVQLYFIIANMAAVPLTALFVMPAGLVAVALMPLGLERLALVPMGWGVRAILWIGRTTSALPAATLPVPHMPLWGLVTVALGLAWLGLWRTRLRLAGVLPILLGLASPACVTPPAILVSSDARLIALRTADGMVLQALQKDSFTLDAWRQYWAESSVAAFPVAAGAPLTCQAASCLLRPRPEAAAALLVRGPGPPVACGAAAVLVSAEPARVPCPAMALVDRFTVWRDGSQAIWLTARGAVVLSDRAVRGSRPWVPPPPAPHAAAKPSLPMAARE